MSSTLILFLLFEVVNCFPKYDVKPPTVALANDDILALEEYARRGNINSEQDKCNKIECNIVYTDVNQVLLRTSFFLHESWFNNIFVLDQVSNKMWFDSVEERMFELHYDLLSDEWWLVELWSMSTPLWNDLWAKFLCGNSNAFLPRSSGKRKV